MSLAAVVNAPTAWERSVSVDLLAASVAAPCALSAAPSAVSLALSAAPFSVLVTLVSLLVVVVTYGLANALACALHTFTGFLGAFPGPLDLRTRALTQSLNALARAFADLLDT